MVTGALFLAASAVGLMACSAEEDDTSQGEDDIRRKGGALGAACDATRACQTGLVCKTQSSGPPAGAVGLPQPAPTSSSSSGGPPPGAVGLPQPAPAGKCAKPGPGEEGGLCNARIACLPGLECVSASTSSSGGPPPGAVGLPQPAPDGTCKKKSSGPPPGAVGLPLPPP